MDHEKKWTEELELAREYWNKAADELMELTISNIAIPMINALLEGYKQKLSEVKEEITIISLASGMPAAVEFAKEQTKSITGVGFYAAYLMGKEGIPLEKIACIHHGHNHRDN